jgi:hypothetical protein
MLTATTEKEPSSLTWMKSFKANYSIIPHPTTCPKIQKSLLLEKSAIPRLCALSGVKYPYQIIFTTILNFPIPYALASCTNLSLFLRVSMFDMEKSCFFGNSWQSSVPCWDKNQEKHDDDSDQSDSEIVHNIGSRINIKISKQVLYFNQKCIYFHTPVHSPNVVAVVEFVYEGWFN